jgi:RNA polymerase sigma-70 factor, ECF subfamily
MRSRSLHLPAPAAIPSAAAPEQAATPLQDEVVHYFDLLREPLLRYLLTFGLNLADGEEIVQEVFLALFQHLQRQGGRQNLRGWVFRVAHNLGLKRRYREGRPLVPEAACAVADPTPSPEARLLRNEKRRRVDAVVAALPELDRRCLMLRVEGLRYREIAAVLEISLGAVSMAIARALARLARATER